MLHAGAASVTRIVVMDAELHEALTVVEIPASIMRDVQTGEMRWVFLMPPPPRLSASDFYSPLNPPPARMAIPNPVRLSMECVFRGSGGDARRPPPQGQGERSTPLFWYAYADDPELALTLRAAFLPGQLGEVQRRQQEAYWRGAFMGMSLR